MEEFSVEVLANIKQEPETHFELIFSADPNEKPEERQYQIKRPELRVKLKKFNNRWTRSAVNYFDSFFICQNCEFTATDEQILNFHLKTCEQSLCSKPLVESFNCYLCEQRFDSKQLRDKHETESHVKGLIWKCNKCSFFTVNKSYLRRHILNHCWTLTCDICGAKFFKYKTLKTHQYNCRDGLNRKGLVVYSENDKFDTSFEIDYTSPNPLKRRIRDKRGRPQVPPEVHLSKITPALSKREVQVYTNNAASCRYRHKKSAQQKLNQKALKKETARNELLKARSKSLEQAIATLLRLVKADSKPRKVVLA